MGRHTFKTGYYNNHSLKRENNVLGGTNFGTVNFTQDTVGVESVRHVVWILQRRDRKLQQLRPGVQVRRGDVQVRQPRSLRAGQLEGEVQLVDRLRGSLRPCRPAARRAPAERQLPAGQMGAVGGARAVRARLRRQHRHVRGLEPFSEEPVDRSAPGPEHLAGRRDARAELGHRAERSVPVRERDRGHDVPLSKAECRPALRHGLRHIRHAALRPARILRHLLRPAARRQRAGAGWQHLRVHAADAAVLAAAKPGRAPDAVARAAHGLPVQQQAPDLNGMEHRHPDADSLVHVG